MFPQSYDENSSVCPKSSLRNNLRPIPKFRYSRFWQKGSYLRTLALHQKSFQSQPFHTFLFSRENTQRQAAGYRRKTRCGFAATAVAKSLQSCPTLCDPIDGLLPGSPVPGILQARTLEWVAISFSNAWKWKVKEVAQSCPTLSDPMDCSLPGSSIHGIFQARVLEWGAIAFSGDEALGDVFSSLSSTSHTPCRLGQVTESLWALRAHQKWKLRQDALEALIPTFCFNLSSSRLIILDVFSDPSPMPLCASELKAL